MTTAATLLLGPSTALAAARVPEDIPATLIATLEAVTHGDARVTSRPASLWVDAHAGAPGVAAAPMPRHAASAGDGFAPRLNSPD